MNALTKVAGPDLSPLPSPGCAAGGQVEARSNGSGPARSLDSCFPEADALTRAELVSGYTQIEKHRDRHPRRQKVQQRILGGGLFEERTYEGSRLVQVRRYTLGVATPTARTPASHRPKGVRLA